MNLFPGLPKVLTHGIFPPRDAARAAQADAVAYVHNDHAGDTGNWHRRKFSDLQRVERAPLKPLPYPEPDRLVAVWETAPG